MIFITKISLPAFAHFYQGTRPAGHEAKAEARNSEAEDEAEVQKFFRGRGQTR